MLSTAEIGRGVYGALRFLQRDPAAPQYFDNTPESCLRSFRVMLPVAPLYVLYMVLVYSRMSVATDTWEIVLAQGLLYVVEWLLFPVLFYEIASRRGWLDAYPRYISVLNWMSLPATAVLLVGKVLSMIAPAGFSAAFELSWNALLVYWILTVTRMVVKASWPMSVMLLIVNLVPSLMLSLVVDRFLGSVPLPGT